MAARSGCTTQQDIPGEVKELSTAEEAERIDPDGPAPAVSVVIPVYNSENYVEQAIHSILDQTFRDMEVIVVNDGSTDRSGEVIKAIGDPRIRYIEQKNTGLPGALNTGLKAARAALIARHDHDDVALPTRIEEQVAYMQAHPEVGALGTWATVTDMELRPRTALRHPTSHAYLRFFLLFDSPFVHPSMMFRRSVIGVTGPYLEDPAVYEDLEMWTRMVRVTRVSNLPKELMLYREIPTSISRNSAREERLMEQRRRNFRHEFPAIPKAILEKIIRAGMGMTSVSAHEFSTMHTMLSKLMQRYGGDATDQQNMRAFAHSMLSSFRIVPGKGRPARILDRLLKTRAFSRPVRQPWMDGKGQKP